jgi:protein-S-isoprenylcysteine O-methyltransferase Ste14
MSTAASLWARWRVRLGYPLAMVYALLARPTPEMLAWGAILGLAGLLIRAAAAGHLYKHARLATSGPYQFTRNPLYFGSALLAAGLLVGGRSWMAAALVTAYFALFYSGVMRSEAAELHARYGEEFAAYAARVPLFFPARPARSTSSQKFSFAQYRANREYQAALGFALALVLLYAKMKWMPG